MQRAMARQAESERERRAKIIAAEGEYQASQRLRQAADRLESPTALQLRLFQTLGEISSENSSTVILPVPLDLFRPYVGGDSAANGSSSSSSSSSSSGGEERRRRREAQQQVVRGGEEEEEEEAERLYEEAVGDVKEMGETL
jgi:hypothetical protein